MAKGDFLEEAELNTVLRGVAFPTLESDLSIGLFTTELAEDGSGTEVTGGGYARATVERAAGSFTAPTQSGGMAVSSNAVVIEFPEPTDAWGTVVWVGVFSGTDLCYRGELPNPRVINDGDPAPKFDPGGIVVRAS